LTGSRPKNQESQQVKSKLADIASIAEIVASVGVIFSLIFVALEVREGSQQTRAATAQLIIQNEQNMVSVLIENAATWEKVLAGAPLDPGEETRRAINLFQLAMLDSANRYRQFRAGYLPQETWDGQVATLPELKKLPIYHQWRSSLGGQSQDRLFLEFIDSMPVAD
jgi:hypothetical protein